MNRSDLKYKPTLQDLQGVCDSIHQKMDHSRSKGRTVSKKDRNWASSIDHPCLRFLTYTQSHWRDAQLPSVETEYLFEEGKDGEKKLKKMIEDEGYEIILAQKYFTWDKYQISGKTDGFLTFKIPGQQLSHQGPLEIKTVAPHAFDKMRTIEEIQESRSYWIRKCISQLNIYMLMANYEWGFLALKTYRRRPRILPMMVNLELGEKCLQTCEQVNHFVAKGTLPDRILYDPSLCDICNFDHICQPVKVSQYPDEIDERTAKDLVFFKKWHELGSRWKKTAEDLRKRLKGINAIAEGVQITTTEYETTVYDWPEDMKQIYGRKDPRTKVTLEPVEDAAETE